MMESSRSVIFAVLITCALSVDSIFTESSISKSIEIQRPFLPQNNIQHNLSSRNRRDTTTSGGPCSGSCEKRGKSYYWCYIPYTGRAPIFWKEWDYCTRSPQVTLKETTCGSSRKCDRIIRFGKTVAWCCDETMDKCEKCFTTDTQL